MPTYNILHDFESATSLHLKPKTSILNPIAFKLPSCNLDMVRAWLRRDVPLWKNLLIKKASNYLGFFLGPSAGKEQWTAPAKKYSDKVIRIRDMKLPLRLAAAKHDY